MNTFAAREELPLGMFGLPPTGAAIDEALLQTFADAIEPYEVPSELLANSPAQELSAAMKKFVASMKSLDVDRIARKFNWYERLTGLNLQARIEFDLAAYQLDEEMIALGVAATRGRRARTTLQSEQERLGSLHDRHERLIAWGTDMLQDKDPADYHVGRFQRRLANLEALAASDRLSDAQIGLAIDALDGLLDRYEEIEKLLYPLWQQHALAIAQSATDSRSEKDAIHEFLLAHRQMSERLDR